VSTCALLLDKLVNDRVQEDSANANAAAKELHGVKGLSEDKGHSDNDNDALSSVGDGCSNRVGLLDGQSSKLVVTVEVHSTRNKVETDNGVGLEELNEGAPLVSLLDNEDGDGHGKGQKRGEGKLVPNGPKAILEPGGVHELLVLVTLEGSEKVGNASRDQSRPSEVKLLDRGKDNSTNDDGEAHPLRSWAARRRSDEATKRRGDEGGVFSNVVECRREQVSQSQVSQSQVSQVQADDDTLTLALLICFP